MSAGPSLFRRRSPQIPSSSPTPTPSTPSAVKSLFPPVPPPTSRRPSSEISLPSAITSASHVATTPLLAGISIPASTATTTTTTTRAETSTGTRTKDKIPDAPTMFRSNPSSSTATASGEGGGKGGEAHEKMWAEMQQKLKEVELSADHVFGISHARALEELRNAQVGLAQAWMRSEEDALDGEHVEVGKKAFGGGEGGKGKGLVAEDIGGGAETEDDILLARKRRLANDLHFGRVAVAVRDVTRRLEMVAEAMDNVEMESRGIWAGSSESEVTSIR